MRGQRLREERTGGHGEVVGHRDDLELVAQRAGDDLHHLADAQHLLVADVEDLPGGGVGLLEREQERVREVLGVAVMVQRETVVRHHDPAPTVEHPAHDEPLARHELVRPVHVRIAEVRGVGMDREEHLLGAGDAIALLVLRGLLHRGRVLGDRHRQSVRLVEPRVHEAAVRGNAADRHELPDSALQHVGDGAESPVHREDRVEGAILQRGAQRGFVVRVGVHVLDRGGRLVALVEAAMQDGDVVTAVDEPVDQRDAGRSGPTDHQDALRSCGHAEFRTTFDRATVPLEVLERRRRPRRSR